MSKRRRSTLKESNRELRGKLGPNGRRLCRFCKKEVPAVRRTFCSEICIHEWKLRSDVSYLREHVYRRDLGICATCKVDTRYQKINLENILHAAGYNEKDTAYQALLKSLRLTAYEARRSLWQADHIIPVIDGGGECNLGNIQSLCIACHKSKNAAQASYKAKPKGVKEVKPLKRLGLEGVKGIKGIKKL